MNGLESNKRQAIEQRTRQRITANICYKFNIMLKTDYVHFLLAHLLREGGIQLPLA